MSIKFLADNFIEHITVDTKTITTKYHMTVGEYLNGYGTLVNCKNEIYTTDFYLPHIGDNFGLYYSTTYLNDCVLTDISMEHLFVPDVNAPVDPTGFNLDHKIGITYTWSNEGANDTREANQASSWLLKYDTALEFEEIDTYVDNNNDKIYWADKYYTALNPQIEIEKTDSEGNIETVGSPTYGLYNSETSGVQRKYISQTRDQIPTLSKRTPNTTVTITTYADFIRAAYITSILGSINSTDLLTYVYATKEEANRSKQKLPGWVPGANDWISENDTGKWMFVDFEMADLSNGFYQYDFTFEYNKNGWNNYIEYNLEEAKTITIDTKFYDEKDFYTTIFSGMDLTPPSDRTSR